MEILKEDKYIKGGYGMEFYEMQDGVTLSEIEKFNYPNRKLAVVIQIYNDEGLILLQKRGSKSRDENGLYEDIGGKVEEDDSSFKAAIERELLEEVGSEVEVKLSEPVGLYHNSKNGIDWLFVVYLGKYIRGEFKVMEPLKCEGYRFFQCEEAMESSMVTKSSKFLIKSLKRMRQ